MIIVWNDRGFIVPFFFRPFFKFFFCDWFPLGEGGVVELWAGMLLGVHALVVLDESDKPQA